MDAVETGAAGGLSRVGQQWTKGRLAAYAQDDGENDVCASDVSERANLAGHSPATMVRVGTGGKSPVPW